MIFGRPRNNADYVYTRNRVGANDSLIARLKQDNPVQYNGNFP